MLVAPGSRTVARATPQGRVGDRPAELVDHDPLREEALGQRDLEPHRRSRLGRVEPIVLREARVAHLQPEPARREAPRSCDPPLVRRGLEARGRGATPAVRCPVGNLLATPREDAGTRQWPAPGVAHEHHELDARRRELEHQLLRARARAENGGGTPARGAGADETVLVRQREHETPGRVGAPDGGERIEGRATPDVRVRDRHAIGIDDQERNSWSRRTVRRLRRRACRGDRDTRGMKLRLHLREHGFGLDELGRRCVQVERRRPGFPTDEPTEREE